MRIDLKRLRKDVKSLKATRGSSPIGRVKSGATAVIRNNLDELERMNREDGALFTEIAAGLAAQGVTEGDGRPITGRRLIKLMNNVKAQAERRNNKQIMGTVSKPRPVRADKKTVSLAPEMRRQQGAPREDRVVTEQDIRLTELHKHAHLLKKR